MTDFATIGGVSAVIDRYDAFVLDLWGVVHNGREPYPGVLDCLTRLKAAGKGTLLLSNAPRRAYAAVGRLAEMGVTRDLFGDILTSGDDTWHALRTRGAPDAEPFYRDLGRRAFLLGAGRDLSLFDEVDVEQVRDVSGADFILCTNLFEYGDTPDTYAALLREGRARDLPMICANPDLVVVIGETLEYCAGAIGAAYEKLGGFVMYHGKPHAPVYARARAMLGGADPRRVLCVGDSLRTDIAGANAAGLDSLLVTGGIHKDEFVDAAGAIDPARIAAMAAREKARPTWIGPGLRW
ncbi:MAG: TIGR01459 family HAD-type hydrolase [Rhodospirillales bacterium]|nr:MAG: TIGR01459 family HAD-type hydrolase [Rhodospirillales bacterium]